MNFDEILKDLHDKGIIPGVLNRIFLYGPPGTGKSTIGKTIFGNVERVTLSGKMPIEDLLGMMTQDESGKLVWIDGPATRALRQGKCLVLDEVNQEGPALRCTLHALLDNPAGITLPNGERVEAAPGYCVIGTSNDSPANLTPALIDRFELALPCLEASAGLRAQLGNKSQKVLDNVTRRNISESKEIFNWQRPITPRFLLTIESLLKRGMSLEEIANYLFSDSVKQQTDLLTLFA